MKRSILLFVVISISLILAACGSNSTQPDALSVAMVPPSTTPAEVTVIRPTLDTSYDNALSSRLLLAFGILELSETSTPVNVDQAAQLLMLWQGLDNLTNSGISADAEVSALLSQIELTLSPEQIIAINAMKLTQVELQIWSQENRLTQGQGTGTGTSQGKGMSPEARATKQAENGMTEGSSNSENGLSSAITTALINHLESVSTH